MSDTTAKKPKPKPPEQSEALTVLVLLGLVLSVVIYFAFFSESKTFILKAKFNQADGLKIGAEVQCAGVKIGKVKDIDFLKIPENSKSEEDLFELILELSSTINGQPLEKVIRKDATAIIIITGSLGDRGVNIVPGTPTAPPVASGDYILGKIQLTPAMISDNVDRIRKKFNQILDILDINTKWINDGKGNIGKFYKPDNELVTNLKELNKTTDQLLPLVLKGNGTIGKFQKDEEFSKMVDRLSTSADKLQEQILNGNGASGRFSQDNTLDDRVSQLQLRANNLITRFNKLEEKVNKGSGSITKFNNPKFKADLTLLENNIDKLSQKITNKRGTAYLLMNDPRLSDNISTISIEMAKLAYDIRQKPRKYVKFTLF